VTAAVQGAKRVVVVVGALPPPVHGASLITRLMADELGKVADVRIADVAPDTLGRSLAYHLVKLRRVLAAMVVLVRQGARKQRRLYFCIAGGSGVYYDIALAALARLLGYRFAIHHHSFTYVNRRDRRTALLFRLCGHRALHICLCPTMAARLKARYGAVARAAIFSNAALMEAGAEKPANSAGPLTLGHFGNLSRVKGLDTVIALFRDLRAGGAPVRLALAGPPAGPAEARLIAAAQAEFAADLDYRGALYGEEKSAFFRGLDVFLFPSRYANEAQPLVLFEAMAAGVPVIAACRGCIGDDVTPESGLVVAEEGAYARAAAAQIGRWLEDRASLHAASDAARRRLIHLRRMARCEVDRIVGNITGINVFEAETGEDEYPSQIRLRNQHAGS
jgi:glycosyltransferase involved in cell wall biosynthesis